MGASRRIVLTLAPEEIDAWSDAMRVRAPGGELASWVKTTIRRVVDEVLGPGRVPKAREQQALAIRDPAAAVAKRRQGSTKFAAWWAVYPNRIDEIACAREFDALDDMGLIPPLDVILSRLHQHLASRQWLSGVIPLPSTYISRRQWKDGPEPRAYSRKEAATMSVAMRMIQEGDDEK